MAKRTIHIRYYLAFIKVAILRVIHVCNCRKGVFWRCARGFTIIVHDFAIFITAWIQIKFSSSLESVCHCKCFSYREVSLWHPAVHCRFIVVCRVFCRQSHLYSSLSPRADSCFPLSSHSVFRDWLLIRMRVLIPNVHINFMQAFLVTSIVLRDWKLVFHLALMWMWRW